MDQEYKILNSEVCILSKLIFFCISDHNCRQVKKPEVENSHVESPVSPVHTNQSPATKLDDSNLEEVQVSEAMYNAIYIISYLYYNINPL